MADARQAKQDRSRRTFEKTLQATEELLQRKPFERIAISDIVEAAGSSVGSFYARFGSKEGLLPHLYERYDRQLHEQIDAALAKAEWRGRSLVEQARWFVDMHLRMCRERRWLMRAVGFYIRSDPQTLSGAMQHRRTQLHRRIAQSFAPHFDQIAHPDPASAVEFGLYVVAAVCRDKILFAGPHARATEVSDERLLGELTQVLLAYLVGGERAAANKPAKKRG